MKEARIGLLENKGNEWHECVDSRGVRWRVKEVKCGCGKHVHVCDVILFDGGKGR